MSQLTTFVKPKPNRFIMKLLTPINRILNLKGVSFLKWIPLVNKLPIIKGLCDITKIELNKEDEITLKNTINSENITFIGPNHPEFYTDWMLDKELSSRFAPKMASWATHNVVNGMGKNMQAFWLKNNLIAQIPGSGNKDAKDYSIEHAIKGHGVLLHPEGHVTWHSDKIAPLYSGIFDMAYQAYLQTEGKKPVYLVPVVWKLKFNKNIHNELHKEIDYIENNLNLKKCFNKDIEARILYLFKNILKELDNKYQLNVLFSNIVQYHKEITIALFSKLSHLYSIKNSENITESVKTINKLLKNSSRTEHVYEKKILKDINKLLAFDFSYFDKDYLTQENIAEILKKIRIQFCTKGILNIIHKFIPIPVSSRTAYIKVPQPILLNELIHPSSKIEDVKNEALNKMKNSLQNTLDDINHDFFEKNNVVLYNNIFK